MTEIFSLCQPISEVEFLNQKEWRVRRFLNSSYKANIKFDGERVMANVKNGDVTLMNRNKRCVNANFKEVVDELKKLKGEYILDGEVMSIDDDFTKLQKRALTKDKKKQEEMIKQIPVMFMVFDILKIKNNEVNEVIQDKDLDIRITHLNSFEKQIDKDSLDKNTIKVAEFKNVKEMYNQAKAEKREGIVIKNLSSSYSVGRNYSNWYKLKFFKEDEFIAVSYTENPKGIRVENKEGNAIQVSHKDKDKIKEMIDKDRKAVIYIQYLTKSKDGKYRFPSYRGLKPTQLEDKNDDDDDDVMMMMRGDD
jgi:ATP-dependent DNA ligase